MSAVTNRASVTVDLAGPTVDDDIRRAFSRYGANSVMEAIKRQTTRKRGPVAKKDWPLMHDILMKDAQRLLERGDRFNQIKNYSIATEFADKYPGHSHAATVRRIQRKLAKDRKYFTLVEAESLSKIRYPHADYLMTVEQLTGLHGKLWRGYLDHAKGCLSDYTLKFGIPPASMTMQDIESNSAKALSFSQRRS